MMAVVDMSLGELLANLQTKFGRDFSNYHFSCLQRRVSIRMAALRLSTLDEYMTYLSAHPAEIEQLLDTVTIHVTEFFRDHDVFDAIARNILPAMVERKLRSSSRMIRIWSAGCSTGEETYSLAILTFHYLSTHGIELGLEVYGTDISKEACAVARSGVYPERRVSRIPANLKQRYFEPDEAGFRVAEDLKRRVKFSVHDLFSAPPFSLLDLVVCRNVLIHFDNAVRGKVLGWFHAALESDGILILGRSEAVMGTALDLFELVDPRNKICRKIVLRDS